MILRQNRPLFVGLRAKLDLISIRFQVHAGGRISVEDIKNHACQINAKSKAQEATPSGSVSQILAQSLPDFSKWGAVEREPMSNVRRATAKHMVAAWSTIPHVTQSDKADITELENSASNSK